MKTSDINGATNVFRAREQTKAYYNRISRFYDWIANWSERSLRETALQLLGAQAGEQILEIGFGTGLNLGPLAESVGPSGRVCGIDLSPGMVAIAQRRVDRSGLRQRVELTCGDALLMPYPPESLDGVLMSFSLELFDPDQIPQVLAQVRRVLVPQGRLVVAALSKEGPRQWAVRVYEWLHARFPRALDCRPIFVKQVLESAGFRVDKAISQTLGVPVEIVLGGQPCRLTHAGS